MSKEQLIQKLMEISKYGDEIVMIRSSDWKAIGDAYGDTPLLARISGRTVIVSPVMDVDSKEISFDISSCLKGYDSY